MISEFLGENSRNVKKLPAVLAGAALFFSGCGGSDHPTKNKTVVQKLSQKQNISTSAKEISTIMPQEAQSTAEKYAKALKVIRATKPLRNTLAYKGCGPIHFPEANYLQGTIVERTILESHDEKGGYLFYATERTDKNGRGAPDKALNISMTKFMFNGCKRNVPQGVSETLDIALDKTIGQTDNGWSMSYGTAPLNGPVPMVGYSTYQDKDPKLREAALSSSVFKILGHAEATLLSDASRQASVSNVQTPHIS